MAIPTALLLLLRGLLLGRQRLLLENLALRQQLIVLRRKVPRPRPTDRDRRFWLLLRGIHDGWRESLLLFKPETVLRWHRKGWRWYLGRTMKGHPQGRPPIGWKLFRLLRRLQEENPTWGAARITSELRLLGHSIGQTTVARYMKRHGGSRRSQSWKTFIRNNLRVTAACDFFVVPTVTFRNMFVFVVLSHDRRLIRHIAVTADPTAEWTARQIIEAFPDGQEPRYLVRDRDPMYGNDFKRHLESLAIADQRIAPHQPWMNAYCERVIGTLRRECTDHLMVFSERQLLACLREYVAYYNAERPHLRLERNAPIPRRRELRPAAVVRAVPVLGGLHHRYRAVA